MVDSRELVRVETAQHPACIGDSLAAGVRASGPAFAATTLSAGLRQWREPERDDPVASSTQKPNYRRQDSATRQLGPDGDVVGCERCGSGLWSCGALSNRDPLSPDAMPNWPFTGVCPRHGPRSARMPGCWLKHRS